MSRGIELIALIDLIYEAALDNVLWPGVLIKLADAMGAAQVAMPSMDWRANVVRSRRASIPICLHLGRNIGRSMIRLCRELLFAQRARSILLLVVREKCIFRSRGARGDVVH